MRTSSLLVGTATSVYASRAASEHDLSWWIRAELFGPDDGVAAAGVQPELERFRAASSTERTTTITVTASCPLSISTISFPNATCSGVSFTKSPVSASATASSGSPPTPGPSTGQCQLPSSPIPNDQQVGNSSLGTLCSPSLPKWLPGTNGEQAASPPWGDLTVENSDATIEAQLPDTGVTRSYDFTISRSLYSPDGVLRDMIVINNQFPGPAIEANWGDWIEVTVHNNISHPEEGTSLHWHGMLQRGTPWEDGVPSVSQCPIAPVQSYTYRFRAEVYGSSFYHAHYSAQYTAGVVGPMIVHGPASAPYDIDLGAVMLSDWNHIPYFSMVEKVVGTDLSEIPPSADSGLINGRGQFNCSQPSYSNSSQWLGSNIESNLTWTCVDGAERANFRFQKGKTHRLRLMNTGADGVQKFSVDGHNMIVIATDYTPVVPYASEVITLGVGQRTDILITADQDSTSSWWMRSELPGQALCGGLGSPSGPEGFYPQVLAGIYYEDADTTLDPVSVTSLFNLTSCSNTALDLTIPAYPIAAPANTTTSTFTQDILLGLSLNATGSYNFLINNQTYRADYNTPLLYVASNESYPFEADWNVYNFESNKTLIFNITNLTPFYHPFHFHGHTFQTLYVSPDNPAANAAAAGPPPGISAATGPPPVTGPPLIWTGSIVRPANPMRRDTQLIPPLGSAVLAVRVQTPGVWPLHCHSAWHLSGGLGMNVLVLPDQIEGLGWPEGQRGQTCEGWDAWTTTAVVDQVDSGS